MHSFRIRIQTTPEDDFDLNTHDRPTCPDGFLYGYSHFTQRRDPSSKRGYQQVSFQSMQWNRFLLTLECKRSLVILTPHAYPALFYTLLSYLGQSFLTHGGPMLEVACHNIANWCAPLVLHPWLSGLNIPERKVRSIAGFNA